MVSALNFGERQPENSKPLKEDQTNKKLSVVNAREAWHGISRGGIIHIALG